MSIFMALKGTIVGFYGTKSLRKNYKNLFNLIFVLIHFLKSFIFPGTLIHTLGKSNLIVTFAQRYFLIKVVYLFTEGVTQENRNYPFYQADEPLLSVRAVHGEAPSRTASHGVMRLQ